MRYSSAKYFWHESAIGLGVRCLLNMADDAGAFNLFREACEREGWGGNDALQVGEVARAIHKIQGEKLARARGES